MTERVQVIVLDGRSLRAPDGKLIGAGERLEVSAAEAAFFEHMGAARIVTGTPPDDKPRAATSAPKR